MKIYAISDLHLSINCNKPMNIFGPKWDNYLEKIESSMRCVTKDDIVLIAGDISWAMKLSDALPDLEYIHNLPGKKIIIRGNHDYWWSGISALRTCLPSSISAIQNDAIMIGDTIFCGTRGWTVPEYEHKSLDDEKIYNRELLRLEMSLKAASILKTNNQNIMLMIHYPPFNSKMENNEFTDLIEKYGVHSVIYGHLHAYDKKQSLVTEKNGVSYYLTSCDLVDNTIVEIKI